MKSCLIFIPLFFISRLSSAQSVNFEINQSLLNKFAQSLGATQGTAGNFSWRLFLPCPKFSNPFRWCWKTVASGRLDWELRNPQLQVHSQRIDFTANVRGNVGIFRFPIDGGFVNANGTALARLNSGTNTLRFDVSQISVPVIVRIPIFGDWHVTDITINPHYNISYPITTFGLNVVDNQSGTQRIKIRPSVQSLSLNEGVIKIFSQISIWQ